MNHRAWIGSSVLLGIVAATGVSPAAWKYEPVQQVSSVSTTQFEPVESVTAVVVKELEDQSMSAKFPSRKFVSVPLKALLKGRGGDQVFVIARDNEGNLRAYSRRVERGPMFGKEVVIRAGLSTGERVAASGSFRLRDAALVTIANEREHTP